MTDKRKVAFLVKVIRKVYNGLNRPIYTVSMPEKIQEAVFQVELPESSMDDADKAEILKEAIEGCFFHPQDHPPSELQHALDIAYQDEIAKEKAEFDKREKIDAESTWEKWTPTAPLMEMKESDGVPVPEHERQTGRPLELLDQYDVIANWIIQESDDPVEEIKRLLEKAYGANKIGADYFHHSAEFHTDFERELLRRD